MNFIRVRPKVDVSNLHRGLELLERLHTRRTPAVAANSAAYMVWNFTYSKMPAVAQTRIDTELQVQTVPIMKVATRGPRKGMRIGTGENAIVHQQIRTRAMMIVLARMHPGSDFNQLTGGYWALKPPNLNSGARRLGAGTSNRAEFWAWVEEVADRMVKARHSSTEFLKSAFKPGFNEMEPFVSHSILARRIAKGYQRGSGAAVPEGIGWAKPAQPGTTLAIAEMANAVGCAGRNQVLNEKHNEALWRIMLPLLQRSVNEEAANTMAFVARTELERLKPALAPLGFK